jgi:hypothetical protein
MFELLTVVLNNSQFTERTSHRNTLEEERIRGIKKKLHNNMEK